MTFSQTQADFHVPLLLCLNLQLTEDRKEKMRTCTVNSLNPRMASGSRCQESSASFVSWDLSSKRPKDIHPGPLRCMRVKWRKNRAMISQVPLESLLPGMLSVLQQEAALWKAEASLPDHFPGAS